MFASSSCAFMSGGRLVAMPPGRGGGSRRGGSAVLAGAFVAGSLFVLFFGTSYSYGSFV